MLSARTELLDLSILATFEYRRILFRPMGWGFFLWLVGLVLGFFTGLLKLTVLHRYHKRTWVWVCVGGQCRFSHGPVFFLVTHCDLCLYYYRQFITWETQLKCMLFLWCVLLAAELMLLDLLCTAYVFNEIPDNIFYCQIILSFMMSTNI